MTSTLFVSIAATGFAVAFLHAAIPTHWLPFVLVGRGQRWSHGKTLGVTAAASLGHIGFTMLIGVILMIAGLAVQDRIGKAFDMAVAGFLVLLGGFYIVRHLRGHTHASGGERRYGSDRAAIAGLITLLALSPCEAFLPIYLANVRYGWTGYALLSVVFGLATAVGMLLFTALTLAGAEKLRLERLARFEGAILGGALILLGVVVFALRP